MDSETSYEIIPINKSCSTVINNNSIVSSKSTAIGQQNQHINNINNQHTAYAQYDNVDNLNVQPLYGGGKKIFTIKFRNKMINIEAKSKKNAIQLFLNNKVYKRDQKIEVSYHDNVSSYLIRVI
jgi:hypothetical protein